MTLGEYMAAKGLKDADFAPQIGVSRGYVTQLRLGIRTQPSLKVAQKIAEVSEGEVPVTAWPQQEVAA